MPNYWYKCNDCSKERKHVLSISYDPSKTFPCACGGEQRRIIKPGAVFPKDTNKVFAGDWFKKTYGHDIGEVYEDKARQQESRKQLEQEFRKNDEV